MTLEQAVLHVLIANCGRPWNEVLSLLGHDKAIMKQVALMVETKLTTNRDGLLIEANGNVFMVYGLGARRKFYVDPRTNVLCEVTEKHRSQGWKDDAQKILDEDMKERISHDDAVYRFLDGRWYEFQKDKDARILSAEDVKIRGLKTP